MSIAAGVLRVLVAMMAGLFSGGSSLADSIDDLVSRGGQLNEGRRYEEAISVAWEVIRADATSDTQLFSALKTKGSAHLRLGEYSKAIASFTSALQLYPDDLWVLWQRCWASAHVDKFTSARIDCDKARRIVDEGGSLGSETNAAVTDYDRRAVHAAQAELFRLAGRPEYSLDIMKQAGYIDEADFGNFEFVEKTAELELAVGNFQEAIRGYDGLLTRFSAELEDKDKARLLVNRGDANFGSGRFESAEKDYEQLSHLIDNAFVLYKLCSAYISNARFDQAVESCKELTDREPTNQIFLDAFGVALLNKGDRDGAKKVYQRLLELNPSSLVAKSALEGLQ